MSNSTKISPTTDHLVYAVPDLAEAVDRIEAEWGVRPAVGGKHPTGTHNALLALGERTYLEIIAVDPEQEVTSGRSFGLDTPISQDVLRTWAVAVPDIEALIAQATENGYDPGTIKNGARSRPDGVQLSWRSTQWREGWPPQGSGVIPFVIEWGEGTPHPAGDSPQGCTLVSLKAVHPEPETVAQMLAALGIAIPVGEGETPGLMATIQTPNGTVELK